MINDFSVTNPTKYLDLSIASLAFTIEMINDFMYNCLIQHAFVFVLNHDKKNKKQIPNSFY